jgi:UDP-N-acetylmuramyl pentapeptide phosphotransferase/UDP-N-acetylglucosamine-1-phosphate transferase
MEQIIIGGIVSFLVTFYAIPITIRIAKAKKLYDEPDDKRKLHKMPIPSLGGVGIFGGFALAILLTGSFWEESPEFQYFMGAFFVIFFVGLKDDILNISPLKKFAGQLIVAGILMFKANLVINNMHGFLGIYEIHSSLSYIFTLFTMVVIINAFNLIDGVDGLAGSVGLITAVTFGTYFMITGNIAYAVLGYALGGSLLAFLIYNFHPAKIFMGDTGSLLIGLVNTILVVKFIEVAPSASAMPIAASPAIGFGIMLLPLLDTLRVFGIRIMHGRSPFSPDRNHIHHLLLDRGLCHRNVTLTAIAASLTFIGISFSAQVLGTTWLIVLMTALFFSAIYILYLTRRKARMRVIRGEEVTEEELEDGVIGASKRIRLVSLFTDKATAQQD